MRLRGPTNGIGRSGGVYGHVDQVISGYCTDQFYDDDRHAQKRKRHDYLVVFIHSPFPNAL